MSREKCPHSGSRVASWVPKASCPEQTGRVSHPSRPTRVSYSPPLPRFSHMATKRAWCYRDSRTALSVGHVPWDFKAGYLSFYPAKESQHGFLVNLERGAEPGAWFPFLMEKGRDHRGLANGEGGPRSLPSRDSLWSWKFLRAPRIPFSLAHTQVPGGMDCKILYFFKTISFSPR